MFRTQVPLLSLLYKDNDALRFRYFTEGQHYQLKHAKALKRLYKERYIEPINSHDFRFRVMNLLCDYIYYEDQVDRVERKKFLHLLKRKGLLNDLEKARSRNYADRLEYYL